ncbi:MAG: hypothetical protein R3D29_02055 [Nitratireductor sp.]
MSNENEKSATEYGTSFGQSYGGGYNQGGISAGYDLGNAATQSAQAPGMNYGALLQLRSRTSRPHNSCRK